MLTVVIELAQTRGTTECLLRVTCCTADGRTLSVFIFCMTRGKLLETCDDTTHLL